MRKLILILSCAFFISSCQKEIVSPSTIGSSSTVSSSALSPINGHVVTFNYPNNDVKQYSFIKTFYADKRVNSLKLNSPLTVESAQGGSTRNYFDVKFTYSPNKALMHGLRTNYFSNGYKTNTNDLEFNFNQYNLCTSVYEINSSTKARELKVKLYYNTTNPNLVFLTKISFYSGQYFSDYFVQTSKEGNITSIFDNNKRGVRFGFNLQSNPNKIYFYEPTHDVINYLYDLLETMQWVPMPKNERTTISTQLGEMDGKPVKRDISSYVNQHYNEDGSMSYYQLATYYGIPVRRMTWKF